LELARRGVARPRIGADLRLKLAINERNGGQRERICLALFGARLSNRLGSIAGSRCTLVFEARDYVILFCCFCLHCHCVPC
jgi:hypothetical protein